MNKAIVGLYGMVGTGKSTVSKYLQSLGWNYINQDLLGHEVLLEYSQQIVSLFGQEILTQDQIDRKKLSAVVFNNPEKRQLLMDFSYPIIIQKTLDLLTQKTPTIIEGAFFYKVRHAIPYTHLIYLTVKLSLLNQRLLQRGHSQEWINNVINSQQDISDHQYLADFTITNNSDIHSLHQQIDHILKQISTSL